MIKSVGEIDRTGVKILEEWQDDVNSALDGFGQKDGFLGFEGHERVDDGWDEFFKYNDGFIVCADALKLRTMGYELLTLDVLSVSYVPSPALPTVPQFLAYIASREYSTRFHQLPAQDQVLTPLNHQLQL
ncbi:hypothetical protein APHAL10511_000680 [Amanita phalloides]|nr:hypothetical protein APHAL10511_000680 [Amanita phalloides]